MLRPKVLTVAAVLGILACGACFLPPLPQPKRKLPPYLAGVHTVAIQVEDLSTSDPFDSGAMSTATAASFNRLWTDFPVHAEPLHSVNTADATLHIAILYKYKSASLSRGPDGGEVWDFQIAANFTLMARDGRLLWQQFGKTRNFARWFQAAPTPSLWNSREVVNGATYNLALTAGEGMFYPPSAPQP